MSEIQPYTGGQEVTRRDVRRLSRSMSTIQSGSQLRIARSMASEQVSMAKLDIMTAASGAAAGHAARLARLTTALELECPEAAESLHAIRSANTHFLINELAQLERALRYQ